MDTRFVGGQGINLNKNKCGFLDFELYYVRVGIMTLKQTNLSVEDLDILDRRIEDKLAPFKDSVREFATNSRAMLTEQSMMQAKMDKKLEIESNRIANNQETIETNITNKLENEILKLKSECIQPQLEEIRTTLSKHWIFFAVLLFLIITLAAAIGIEIKFPGIFGG